MHHSVAAKRPSLEHSRVVILARSNGARDGSSIYFLIIATQRHLGSLCAAFVIASVTTTCHLVGDVVCQWACDLRGMLAAQHTDRAVREGQALAHDANDVAEKCLAQHGLLT